MRSELDQLNQMAVVDKRISITDGLVDAAAWAKILVRCDLFVAPYAPRLFAINNSGVMSEAIANGIAIAVPEHTTLSDLLRDYGSPGVTFPTSKVEDVVIAVRHAIDQYDTLASCAATGSRTWAVVNGSQQAARAVLQ
jgi:sulfur carrier protein ThiS